MARHRSSFVALLLIAAGCSSNTPSISEVSFALPLSVRDAEYRRLRLTQLGQSRDYEIDAHGRVAAEVAADAPLGIEITILGVDLDGPLPAVALYTDRRTVTPRAGPMTLDITLARAAGQVGSVVPVYEVGGVRHVVDARVTIVDVATATVFASWHPGADEPFELALGRAYELRVESLTNTDEVAVFPLTAESFAPATELVLTSPASPRTAIALPANAGLSVDQLVGDPRLTLECTTDHTCPAAASYTQTLPLIDGLEYTYELGCRYRNAPSLCFVVAVEASSREPNLSLAASPPFIPAASGTITVELRADEPITPASASLTFNGTELCTAPLVIDEAAVSCSFDSGALTTSPADLNATVQNRFGNTGHASLSLRGGSSGGALITGLDTYPREIGGRNSFLLGMKLAGLSTEACLATAINAQYYLVSAPPGTPLSAPAEPLGSFAPVDIDFTVEPDGSPWRGTLWTAINNDSGALPGAYTMRLELESGCGSDTAELGFTVAPPALRWITGGQRLTFSAWSRLGSFAMPLDRPVFSYASSNLAAVAATAMGNAPALAMVAPGTAIVTARLGPDDALGSSAELEVVRGPALAFLQASDAGGAVVTLANHPTLNTFAVPPVIGAPSQLLWDPGTDDLFVVGPSGIAEVTATGAPAGLLVTGLPAQILDAALIPARAGLGARAAVLMAGDLLGFVDLTTGAVTTPTSLIADGCSSSFDALAYRALDDVLIITSEDCTLSRRYPASAAPVTTVTGLDQPMAPTFTELHIDPMSGYLVGLGIDTAYARATDSSGTQTPALLPITGSLDFPPDALALDQARGTPLAAAWDIELQRGLVISYGRLVVATNHTLLELPGTRIGRLLPDATSRVLFLTTRDATPRLLAFDLDTGAPLSLPMTPPAFAALPVKDAVLMAPQILSAAESSTTPGGLVTLRGTGFGAPESMQLYIQGLRAEILATTPAVILARVPTPLSDLPFGTSLVFGLRANDRMIEATPPCALITEPRLLALDGPVPLPCQAGLNCPGTTGYEIRVSSSPRQTFITATEYVYDAGFDFLFTPSTSIYLPTFAADGLRLLAHYDDQSATRTQYWQELRPDLGESRSFTVTQQDAVAAFEELARDPTGRLLAARRSTSVLLFFAADYTPAATPISLARNSTAAGFSADGETLVILEQDNFALSIESFDVTGAPQALSATIAATCPTAPPAFAVLSAEGSSLQGGLTALFANEGALVAADITRAGSSVTMACHTLHELPNPATLAARSPSGRLAAAVSASASQLYLVDPSNPRVRASLYIEPNMDSLTYAPELPGIGGALYTSTLSPTLFITYAR